MIQFIDLLIPVLEKLQSHTLWLKYTFGCHELLLPIINTIIFILFLPIHILLDGFHHNCLSFVQILACPLRINILIIWCLTFLLLLILLDYIIKMHFPNFILDVWNVLRCDRDWACHVYLTLMRILIADWLVCFHRSNAESVLRSEWSMGHVLLSQVVDTLHPAPLRIFRWLV